MKRLRPALMIFAALIVVPVVAIALQSQRAQIGITVIINATANPLGYNKAPAAGDQIVAVAKLRGAPPAIQRAFEAQELHFSPVTANAVAQTSVQHNVRVDAEITPNPTATLLTSDAPGYAVSLSAEAGVATNFPCAYHVEVDTSISNWVLKQGLSNDFTNGMGSSFSGTYLANNSYVSTPLPTATPFVVYADDGGIWTQLAQNSGVKIYCVDLTITMPITTPQGTYSSNAIYTLYY